MPLDGGQEDMARVGGQRPRHIHLPPPLGGIGRQPVVGRWLGFVCHVVRPLDGKRAEILPSVCIHGRLEARDQPFEAMQAFAQPGADGFHVQAKGF